MSLQDAAIAVNRFGLGARPGEIDAAAANPKRWLLEQIEGPAKPPKQFDGFPSVADHIQNYHYRYAIATRELRAQVDAAAASGDKAQIEKMAGMNKLLLGGYVAWVQEQFVLEVAARTNVALTTSTPFRERLVRFWSNHLVVPAIKQQSMVLAGPYEREVIRPHATAKFADMQLASAQSPGMLTFLDNNISVGPNSPYGQKYKFGLNENLGREILELHTLGVDGGYTQADVIALATGITGWSQYPTGRPEVDPSALVKGAFAFYDSWHEPGARVLLGKTYDQKGIAQGEAMLHDIVRHPSTAHFLATKLARHFTTDDPSPELVKRLAAVYLAHDTDLGEVSRALVEAPEVWASAQSKLKQPDDYVVSCLRSLDLALADGDVKPQPMYKFPDYRPHNRVAGSPDMAALTGAAGEAMSGNSGGMGMSMGGVSSPAAPAPSASKTLALASVYDATTSMGQKELNAPGPQGYYDRWSDWSGSDAMLKRVEWSLALATTHSESVDDPSKYLDRTLGALASDELHLAVKRAATKEQAVGLILASPDFQRR